MADIIAENLHGVIGEILADYKTDRIIDKMDVFCRPDKKSVIDILDKLVRIVFPGYFKDEHYRVYSVENNMTMVMEDVAYLLNKQIAIALPCKCASMQSEEVIADRAQEITLAFFRAIPKIRSYIELDVQATFEGDPAASSEAEIIYSYPGLYAICVHRLAHELHVLGVPVIPRIMSEHAHSRTGVDIHPGATIGRSFFIDHATGVVIGETTEIGEHVKIYQGVTLGALDKGRPLPEGQEAPPDDRGSCDDLFGCLDPRRQDRHRQGGDHRRQCLHHEVRRARHTDQREESGTAL